MRMDSNNFQNDFKASDWPSSLPPNESSKNSLKKTKSVKMPSDALRSKLTCWMCYRAVRSNGPIELNGLIEWMTLGEPVVGAIHWIEVRASDRR